MTALLVVDMQKDFLPEGALPVKEGDEIIPFINRLIPLPFTTIVASKDWHPPDHGSFAVTHGREVGEHIMLKGLDQILWPVHCVRDTCGAEFAAGLDTSRFDKVFYKGTDQEIDSYSAFFDNGHLRSTGLVEFLQQQGVSEVYVVGLATDYCVKYSVLDALEQGFDTQLVVDACRAVNVEAGDRQQAMQKMGDAGAVLTTTEAVVVEMKSG